MAMAQEDDVQLPRLLRQDLHNKSQAENPFAVLPPSCFLNQGSLLYTPEHCLVNGGFPKCWWEKPCFNWAKCIC